MCIKAKYSDFLRNRRGAPYLIFSYIKKGIFTFYKAYKGQGKNQKNINRDSLATQKGV